MAMKRVSRGRSAARDEVESRQLRAQVAEELPDLIARHEQGAGPVEIGGDAREAEGVETTAMGHG
jgi:hypothetical protein